MPPERALSLHLTPSNPKKKRIKLNGISKTIDEWCFELGISESTFHRRARLGLEMLAPKGPTGPNENTIYRVKPGPKRKT